MSDGRLTALREQADETDGGETETGSWFDRLRDLFADGSLRDAARGRVGQLVIRVGRKARVPYEVAADPDIHCTAKYTRDGPTAADRDDLQNDFRNYDPDRFDDERRAGFSVDRGRR